MAQRVAGLKKDGMCQCEVNSTMWSFPALKYEAILLQVQTCEGSLSSLQEHVGTPKSSNFIITVVDYSYFRYDCHNDSFTH